MIIRWERSRVGAGLCAVSLSLALPFIGVLAVQIRNCPEEMQFVSKLGHVVQTTLKDQVLQANAESREGDRARAMTAKRAKLQVVCRYLVDWYALLKFREGFLCTELPEETVEFNRYAAAYHALLGVSKSEASELERMEAKHGSKTPTAGEASIVLNR